MPVFSNLEGLDNVRAKINNAIIATEQNTLDIVSLAADVDVGVAAAQAAAAAALVSQSASETNAILSTEQATIATTKASEASVSAVSAAADAELARVYANQSGAYFTETDASMGVILIPTAITIISRIPSATSVDQVAVQDELSFWKRTTLPTSQPYFTTSGGVPWTQVGYRESQVLSTVQSALQGAYGSVRNFASRADVLTWIALNPAPAVGSVLNWGGLSVRYLGTGTVISDMVGYVPNGVATPEHHGWTAALSTALQTTKVVEALQAGYPEVLFSGGNTYLVDYADANLTADCTVRILGTIKGSADAGFTTSPVMRLNCTLADRFRVTVVGGGTGTIDATLRENIPSGSGTGASGSGLLIRYALYYSVEGLFFYSGDSKVSGFGDSGLVLEYCRKGVVCGNFFKGWNDHGIYNTAGALGNANQFAYDLVVTDNQFEEIGGGDVRGARGFDRMIVSDNISVNSSKLVILSGGTLAQPLSCNSVSITGNIVVNAALGVIECRYVEPEYGVNISNNQIYGWSIGGASVAATNTPAINLRGTSNATVMGNTILPGETAQAATATSCTVGIYATDATGDDGVTLYLARNNLILGNTITVFDRSGDVSPPSINAAIHDQTATAVIRDNRLTNTYPFDIYTNSGGSNGSLANPLVVRTGALGFGYGGAVPSRNLTVSNHARIVKSDDTSRYIDMDMSGTSALVEVVSPDAVARDHVINVKTVGGTVTTGTLRHLIRINGSTKWSVASDALAASAPLGIWSRTVAQANALTATAGQVLYISNESGGAVLAFGDGTNWRRVTDRAVIT